MTECHMPERQRGTVKWFDRRKGQGFIKRQGLPDVFVHFTNIISADRNLDPGEEVEFSVIKRQKGLAAQDVIRL